VLAVVLSGAAFGIGKATAGEDGSEPSRNAARVDVSQGVDAPKLAAAGKLPPLRSQPSSSGDSTGSTTDGTTDSTTGDTSAGTGDTSAGTGGTTPGGTGGTTPGGTGGGDTSGGGGGESGEF
jgi:hypothetical protein